MLLDQFGSQTRRRVRRLLNEAYYFFVQPLRPETRVNLGSGRRKWRNWILFDEIENEGIRFFRFSDSATLPLANASVDLVYTSHFLEHVGDPVAEQVVAESFRILKPGGTFAVKIPDFDAFVNAFLQRKAEIFSEVAFELVSHSWPSKGIIDSIHSRFSMMFCGFWDDEWGPHYTSSDRHENRAGFHGPPKLTKLQLEEIVATSSGPHVIAARLREIAESQGATHFNHCNAWGRSEMESLLDGVGFVLTHSDKKTMRNLAREIPDFDDMGSWSSYFIAQKPAKDTGS